MKTGRTLFPIEECEHNKRLMLAPFIHHPHPLNSPLHLGGQSSGLLFTSMKFFFFFSCVLDTIETFLQSGNTRNLTPNLFRTYRLELSQAVRSRNLLETRSQHRFLVLEMACSCDGISARTTVGQSCSPSHNSGAPG